VTGIVIWNPFPNTLLMALPVEVEVKAALAISGRPTTHGRMNQPPEPSVDDSALATH